MKRSCLPAVLFCALAVSGGLCAKTVAATENVALYKVARGAHVVDAEAELNLRDEARDVKVPIRVSYPKEDGRYPLVVWSHGAMGSKENYRPIVDHWVSHGYIVIQPTHGDSLKRLDRRAVLRDQNLVWKHWNTRPLDVKYILDHLDEIETKVPAVKGKIGREKIGMGGHSFGAHTTMLIGGAEPRAIAGRNEKLSDDRPRALVMISPQGVGGIFNEKSWDDFSRPALTVTGTKDQTRQGDSYRKRLEPFRYSPPKDKYLVFIAEAHHGFGGISGAARYRTRGPDNEDHINYVRSVTIAMWDAYLKDDAKARAFLAGDAISKATEGEAKMFLKLKAGDQPRLPGD